MTKSTFLHFSKNAMPKFGRFSLVNVKHKKPRLVDYDEGTEIEFKDMISFVNSDFEIDGKTIKQIIEESEFDDLFGCALDDSNNLINTK